MADLELHRITDFIVNEACELIDIEDLKQCTHSEFNAVLRAVQMRFFNNTELYKEPNGRYIVNNLTRLCNYYLSLCMKYQKIPSFYDFACMLGLEQTSAKDVSSNPALAHIVKNLSNAREYALKGKLEDMKNSPVAFIAIGNNEYGWQNSGSMTNNSDNMLTLDDLPELPRLSQRDTN